MDDIQWLTSVEAVLMTFTQMLWSSQETDKKVVPFHEKSLLRDLEKATRKREKGLVVCGVVNESEGFGSSLYQLFGWA